MVFVLSKKISRGGGHLVPKKIGGEKIGNGKIWIVWAKQMQKHWQDFGGNTF